LIGEVSYTSTKQGKLQAIRFEAFLASFITQRRNDIGEKEKKIFHQPYLLVCWGLLLCRV
jgi:hypothetical protein